jgi:hypothetical protein
MPKLAEIIAPSQLVLESIKKIARDTSFYAIYVFLMPDPVDGTIAHRSFSFVSRRGQFSNAANQFIKQNMKRRGAKKNSKQFRTRLFRDYSSALFLDMSGKNEWRDDARKSALTIIGLLALEKVKRSYPKQSISLPQKNGILLVMIAFGIHGEVLNHFAFSFNPHPKNKSGNVEDALSSMTAFVSTTMESFYDYKSKIIEGVKVKQ